MLHYKLQFGCLVIVLLVFAMYFRARRLQKNVKRVKCFESLLYVSVLYFALDITTVYTVNHLDSVPVMWNNVLHLLYLGVIDWCVMDVFLYIATMVEKSLTSVKWKILAYGPFWVGIVVMVLGIPSIEYLQGTYSNYSMGISVYVCYGLVAYYLGLAYYTWNICRENLPQKSRREFLLCIPAFLSAIVIQVFIPETLLTSLAITVIILGAYCSVENAANTAIVEYHEEVIYAFADVIEGRDGSTGEHVKRTVAYVKAIVEALKENQCYAEHLPPEYIDNLLKAAPMHDFGKIAVTDVILNKPGRLTDEEYEVMKSHTVKGADMIKNSMASLEEPEYVTMACQVARYHHERWDGRGYPEGLSGNAIPLCARIMAIADVFDAVSQKRCYREAMSLDESFAIIKEGAGSQFDPLLADIFLQMRDKVEAVFYQFQEGK